MEEIALNCTTVAGCDFVGGTLFQLRQHMLQKHPVVERYAESITQEPLHSMSVIAIGQFLAKLDDATLAKIFHYLYTIKAVESWKHGR